MKLRTHQPTTAAWAALAALLLTGCGKSDNGAAEAYVQARTPLYEARKENPSRTEMALLRAGCDSAEKLLATWPESKQANELKEKYGDQLDRAPKRVYDLAVKTRDLESFKWALARGVELDLFYNRLLEYWDCGDEWREFLVAQHPAECLPVFMDEAIKARNTRFFNQHLVAFKESGYAVHSPLESTEFNARFCRYIADAIAKAMLSKDMERIEFLMDNMPAFPAVVYIDKQTKVTMRDLGDFFCKKLKDERLARKLIALGYEVNRIDLVDSGFGPDFVADLAAKPDYAVRALGLDAWHGTLTDEEWSFLIDLPTLSWKAVDLLYIDEAIERGIRTANNAVAIRLIDFRESAKPLTRHGYNELLALTSKHKNSAVFKHVTDECDYISNFGLEFYQMAGNYDLFAKFAPNMLAKIAPTMELHTLGDEITYGVVYQVLATGSGEVALYIVQNYDWGADWTRVTGGRTLLMAVCEGGNLEAAKYLIEQKGASVRDETDYVAGTTSLFGGTSAREGKLTPLFFAASSGNCELIKYLKSKGASVNDRSNFGATPLMFAASAGQLEAVNLLIALGADVNAQMNPDLKQAGMPAYDDISTAYNRALFNRNTAIQNALKAAGARP